jgi:hypothetical protein
MPKEYITYLVTAVAMIFMIRRTLRSRRIKVETMWIVPVLLVVIAALAVSQSPPHDPITIAALVLVTLIGAAIGWQRGRLTHIALDSADGALTSKGSVWGLVLILGLYVARQGVKTWALSQPRHGETAIMAVDGLLLFGFASVIVARLEMYLRCRKLLAEGGAAAA